MAIYFDPRTGQYVQVTPGGQRTNLKMQTNVVTSEAPGQSGMSSGSGAPPPPGPPMASPSAGGAAGTGGGGTVNTQGGNISQGAVYGGNVTNTASGGTGSLDASGGSNNVYRETTQAPPPAGAPPAGTPPPGSGAGGPDGPGPCGDGPPCPAGEYCEMGTCKPIPEQPAPPKEMASFGEFLKSKGAM